jgi:predicted DNA-binding protein
MRKTTLYLPDELKERVETVARMEGRSEAEVIRDAIAAAVSVRGGPHRAFPFRG